MLRQAFVSAGVAGIASYAAYTLLSKPTQNQDKPLKNQAFVFIKPHAVTDPVKKLVADKFSLSGIKILSEGPILAEEIDSKQFIDQHYYAIASKATILKPHELNVPADKFEKQFGIPWKDALTQGKVYNAKDACEKLEVDADGLDKWWGQAKKEKRLVKFGGGFYCGQVEVPGKEPIYVFNGFFMSMRSRFTVPGTCIYTYTVEFDPATCSWAEFRSKVLGPTDPADAPAASLRGMINANWKQLGLASAPSVGDNGVHASASPFEALAERMNWLGIELEADPFGKVILAAGVPKTFVAAGAVDPQVALPGGEKGSLFDALEDQDAPLCAETLVQLSRLT